MNKAVRLVVSWIPVAFIFFMSLPFGWLSSRFAKVTDSSVPEWLWYVVTFLAMFILGELIGVRKQNKGEWD